MKPLRILAFLLAIVLSLAAIGAAMPKEGIEICGHYVGFTSLHALATRNEAPRDTTPEVPPEMIALQDSVNYYSRLVSEGDTRFWLPDPHYFDSFWADVSHATRQKRTIRVLHYGDSQIEMDHISSRLRAYMQRRFGGGGPGMVPFRTITPSLTVRMNTSGSSLIHLASFGDSTVVRSRGDYGVMMQCFRLSGGTSTLSLRPSQSKSTDERAKHISSIRLIYNNRSTTLKADLNDRQSKATYLRSSSQQGVGSFVWQLDSLSNSLRLTVSGTADLYGVLVDDGSGVAVDNIPMRGCSGQQFTLVSADKLASAYAEMDVGLIILQFGGNSVPYIKTTKQVSTYCQSLGKQIDHVRACCPNAKVLFVGPSDMSTRIHGQMQTYPILPELVDSLASTAIAHGVAFWSIYHAMGGENTMPQWTQQGLAGQDYIHFSQRGADLMGDRLCGAFENLYTLYTLEHRMQQKRFMSR